MANLSVTYHQEGGGRTEARSARTLHIPPFPLGLPNVNPTNCAQSTLCAINLQHVNGRCAKFGHYTQFGLLLASPNVNYSDKVCREGFILPSTQVPFSVERLLPAKSIHLTAPPCSNPILVSLVVQCTLFTQFPPTFHRC